MYDKYYIGDPDQGSVFFYVSDISQTLLDVLTFENILFEINDNDTMIDRDGKEFLYFCDLENKYIHKFEEIMKEHDYILLGPWWATG